MLSGVYAGVILLSVCMRQKEENSRIDQGLLETTGLVFSLSTDVCMNYYHHSIRYIYTHIDPSCKSILDVKLRERNREWVDLSEKSCNRGLFDLKNAYNWLEPYRPCKDKAAIKGRLQEKDVRIKGAASFLKVALWKRLAFKGEDFYKSYSSSCTEMNALRTRILRRILFLKKVFLDLTFLGEGRLLALWLTWLFGKHAAGCILGQRCAYLSSRRPDFENDLLLKRTGFAIRRPP